MVEAAGACEDASVARFLSPEWMADVSEAATGHVELAKATAGVHLVVQQVVTGAPEGDVRYVVVIHGGNISLRVGDDDHVDVTFIIDWETAVAMATGVVGGQEAFTTGRLQLKGDVGVLLRHGPALAGLEAVFAEVRERTTY